VKSITFQELCLYQSRQDRVRKILLDTFTTRFCSYITSTELKTSLLWAQFKSSHSQQQIVKGTRHQVGGRKGPVEVTSQVVSPAASKAGRGAGGSDKEHLCAQRGQSYILHQQ